MDPHRPDDARDEHGRFRPGASGNPDGRPARKPYLRLLEAAEACGAEVVVMVPPRSVPRPRLRGHRPSDDTLPPAA